MFKETPLLSAIAVLELMQTAKIMGSENFRYLEPITMVGVFFLVISLISAAGIRRVEHWLKTRRGLRPGGVRRADGPFREVTKRYGELTVLDDLDLDVAPNEKVAIIGPSGSGKTTVLRMLMTLERIDEGVI